MPQTESIDDFTWASVLPADISILTYGSSLASCLALSTLH
jgi:hypothetical protein